MSSKVKIAAIAPQQTVPFARRPYLVFARDDSLGSDKRPGTQPRILIVEDDYLIGSQIEAALTQAGFEVIGLVSSGAEAIERAATEQISLAIMDIRLNGDRDGIDTAIELFRRYGICSVFATAHSDPTARQRADAARPLGWVSKPYSMSTLLEVVRKALRSTEK